MIQTKQTLTSHSNCTIMILRFLEFRKISEPPFEEVDSPPDITDSDALTLVSSLFNYFKIYYVKYCIFYFFFKLYKLFPLTTTYSRLKLTSLLLLTKNILLLLLTAFH